MNDQPYIKGTPSPKRTIDRVRNHPYFKPALVVLGVAAGTFLAVRTTLKEVTDEVKHIGEHVHNIDHNVYNTSTHVIDEIHFQQKFRHDNRNAVRRLKNEDQDFEYYPGLGTLINHEHPKSEEKSA